MDLIKSDSYIDIFYDKTCATTKIRTVAGCHVVLAMLLFTLLFNKGFVSAQIKHAQGNQLVPALLLKPSDTMHAQCRHT